MILKYIVPRKYKKQYENKNILYCKIGRQFQMAEGIILYHVKILNLKNKSDIFLNIDLKKLNILDMFKILKYII